MAVISVRLSDEVYSYAEQFAKFNGVNLSSYIRQLIEEKIEDFEDIETVKKIEKDMKQHSKSFKNGISFEQFEKDFENEKIQSNTGKQSTKKTKKN